MTHEECLDYFRISTGPLSSPDEGFEKAARGLCRLGVLRPVFVRHAGKFWFERNGK